LPGVDRARGAAARRCGTPDVPGVRAQGINLALRDAVVAANHLIPALTGQLGVDAVDAACRVVQAEREPEIERAQRLQRRESRGQGAARSGSWRYTLARHGARLLGGHRWAETVWLRRQHDLWFGSRPVRLRLPPRRDQHPFRARTTSSGLSAIRWSGETRPGGSAWTVSPARTVHHSRPPRHR
jgi:hypothetical protein